MTRHAIRSEELTTLLVGRLPDTSLRYVVDLLACQPVALEITPPRKTRLGYYRPPSAGRRWHQISINSNLNPYAFLVTLLHEIAHLHVAITASRRVAPHGKEWKRAYGQLLTPVVEEHDLPEDVAEAVAAMMHNPRASSCADRRLLATLTRYDDDASDVVRLDDLPDGSLFRLASGRLFRHKRRLRTWHLCEEVGTRRAFRVRGSSRAEPVPPS
jgi:hypothetical protein